MTGEQRAELEGQVAMITRQLDTEREEWSQSKSQYNTVSDKLFRYS